MQPNTSPLHAPAAGQRAAERPAAPGLSPLGRYLAAALAAAAFRSDVPEQGVRDLFSGCDRQGFGLGADFEALVLSSLAAMSALVPSAGTRR